MTTPVVDPRKTNGGLPGWLLWVGVGLVVAAIAVVAVIASKGDDKPPLSEETGSVVVGGAETTTTTAAGATTTTGDGVTTTTAAGSTPESTGTALPAMTDGGTDPAIGMTLPTISGQAVLGGGTVTIADDGKAKIIIGMAHWCPHCQREIPEIVEHLKTTPMPADVELYGVSTAVDPTAGNYPPSSWLERVGWTAPTIADSEAGDAAAALGISGFPTFIVVDAENKVVFRTSGEIPMTAFDELVKQAAAGA